jgi:hypothetical protein
MRFREGLEECEWSWRMKRCESKKTCTPEIRERLRWGVRDKCLLDSCQCKKRHGLWDGGTGRRDVK